MSIPKDSRIAIIGAGPAGLAAGMYLEQAGFHDYTILELSLIHISEPTRREWLSRMPSSA